jgi:tetratricopeptide (TPR) repeat protein
MAERIIKLIKDPREGESRTKTIRLISILLAAAALISSLNGADLARRRFDPRELAESALQQALSRGGGDEQVLAKLHQLRRVMGLRPLDSRTRVVYASLLLSLGGSPSDLAAAAFHARVAVSLSPVTVPIVRVAALVLASSGSVEEALPLIREMFEYDPKSAAALLARAESLLRPEQVQLALPEHPEAWLAWASELHRQGRQPESDSWVEAGYRRWPENLSLLKSVAARMIRGSEIEELDVLFSDLPSLPDDPEAAPLFAYRAQYKGMKGDIRGSREDLERALALDDTSHRLLSFAGGTYESIGDYEDARRQWHAALFLLPPEAGSERAQLLRRLARLEEAHGEPAAALRHWRQILEIDPDHEEARRQIEKLTGVPQ